jgi:DNA-binding transcriptional ArsR family regulator
VPADGESRALAALADPTRRSLFEALAAAPASVGELSGAVPVTRPAVSQHLRVLEEAGLVAHERQGTRHVYRVRPEGIAEARRYLDRFWSLAMSRVKAAAERPQEVEEP